MPQRRRLSSVPSVAKAPGATPPRADRDPVTGYFLPGNKASRGNQYLHEQNRVQAAIRAQLDDDALHSFVQDWIRHARGGKSMYLISLMERLCGRVAEFGTVERITELESEIERILQSNREL